MSWSGCGITSCSSIGGRSRQGFIFLCRGFQLAKLRVNRLPPQLQIAAVGKGKLAFPGGDGPVNSSGIGLNADESERVVVKQILFTLEPHGQRSFIMLVAPAKL